jgi:hypothetical protein
MLIRVEWVNNMFSQNAGVLKSVLIPIDTFEFGQGLNFLMEPLFYKKCQKTCGYSVFGNKSVQDGFWILDGWDFIRKPLHAGLMCSPCIVGINFGTPLCH